MQIINQFTLAPANATQATTNLINTNLATTNLVSASPVNTSEVTSVTSSGVEQSVRSVNLVASNNNTLTITPSDLSSHVLTVVPSKGNDNKTANETRITIPLTQPLNTENILITNINNATPVVNKS